MIELPDSGSIAMFKDVTTLVGVIDLMDGQAVHAVRGDRDQYRPLGFCSGDPGLLMDHYANMGIRRFYVADLDSITKNEPNAEVITSLAIHCKQSIDRCEIMFDLGWRGHDQSKATELIKQTNNQFERCRWIAATESMPHSIAISELVEWVGSHRVIVSLDYRQGELLGRHPKEEIWVTGSDGRGCFELDNTRFSLDWIWPWPDDSPSVRAIDEDVGRVVSRFFCRPRNADLFRWRYPIRGRYCRLNRCRMQPILASNGFVPRHKQSHVFLERIFRR